MKRSQSNLATRGYASPAVSPTISPLAPLVRANLIDPSPPPKLALTRPKFIPDQADVPCCVSCALAGALQIIHPEWSELAPLFHYFVTRYDNFGAGNDGLLRIPAAIATLSKQGICGRTLHSLPFTKTAATQSPTRAAYSDGLAHRLRSLFNSIPVAGPSRVVQIREQLRKGFPVVIGLTLPQDYPDSFLDGRLEWSDPALPLRTQGHCLLVLEASDSRNALLVQDSLGPDKFDLGCWWLGYRVVDSKIVTEAHSLIGK